MALHGSSFCYNGDASTTREVHGLPCSFVNSFAKLHCLSKPFLKQYGIGFAKPFGQGCRVRDLPNCCHLSLQTRRSKFFQQASGLVSLRPCQVKREDTQDPLGGESIIMDEQTLEQDLQIAIAEENYVEAAKIRDSLKNLHEDSKTSVLLANARFYDSFRTGDLAAMQTLWAKGNEACVVHPGASGISGYDDVMESWEFVWADYEFPLEIQLKDARVHVKPAQPICIFLHLLLQEPCLPPAIAPKQSCACVYCAESLHMRVLRRKHYVCTPTAHHPSPEPHPRRLHLLECTPAKTRKCFEHLVSCV